MTSLPEDEPTVMLRKRARSRPVPMTHGVAAVLTVLGGRLEGQVLTLRNGDNLAGRAKEADVFLDDHGVSRRHARLTVDVRGRVELLDLGSTNGTFVNGIRVTSESLRIGDRIRIGLEAVLELGQSPKHELLPARDQGVPTGQRRRVSAEPVAMAARGPEVAALGDSEEIMGYARLLQIRRRRLGERHVAVADLLETLGLALQADGQLQRATECLVRAFEIQESREPPAPQATARLLGRLASCDLALGRPHAAVVRLERAEQLLRTTLATAAEIGGIRLLLSQVLWRLGCDQQRSIELARRAHEVLASGGDKTHLLHHGAQAWLRSVTSDPFDDEDRDDG